MRRHLRTARSTSCPWWRWRASPQRGSNTKRCVGGAVCNFIFVVAHTRCPSGLVSPRLPPLAQKLWCRLPFSLTCIPSLSLSCSPSPLTGGPPPPPVQILGQNADLFDLQRILLRAKNRMTDGQQQNMTRWAVFSAGGMLKKVGLPAASPPSLCCTNSRMPP